MKGLLKWMTAAAVVMGVFGGITVATVTSSYRDVQAKVDEYKSVETLLAEAKAELDKDKQALQRAVGEKQNLERKLEAMRRQQAVLNEERVRKGKQLAFAREMLKRQGDVIPVSGCAVAIRRADVEHDAEAMFGECRGLDGQIAAFAEPIAEMARGVQTAEAAIAEAKNRLQADTARLQKLAAQAESYRIKQQIAGLLAKATPEAILSEDRAFDRKMAEVEARFAQLPRTESVTRVDWTALMEGGKPRNGDLATRIDAYLASTALAAK